MAKNQCDYYIDEEIEVACGASYDKGLRKTGYIVNRDDIVSFTRKTGNNYNEISAITLAEGASGFEVTDVRADAFDGSTKALGGGALGAMSTKTVQFLLYKKGASASRAIDALKNGKFVMFVVSNNAGSTSPEDAFEIIGLEASLKCTAYEQNLATGDYENTYLVTLSCDEVNDGNFFAPTSATTYSAILTALKNALNIE